jgi:hypothetical protein
MVRMPSEVFAPSGLQPTANAQATEMASAIAADRATSEYRAGTREGHATPDANTTSAAVVASHHSTALAAETNQ